MLKASEANIKSNKNSVHVQEGQACGPDRHQFGTVSSYRRARLSQRQGKWSSNQPNNGVPLYMCAVPWRPCCSLRSASCVQPLTPLKRVSVQFSSVQCVQDELVKLKTWKSTRGKRPRAGRVAGREGIQQPLDLLTGARHGEQGHGKEGVPIHALFVRASLGCGQERRILFVVVVLQTSGGSPGRGAWNFPHGGNSSRC